MSLLSTRVVNKLRRVSHRALNNRAQLRRLRSDPHPRAAPLARALASAAGRAADPDEILAFGAIEAIRHDLLASRVAIETGAGGVERLSDVCRASKGPLSTSLLFHLVRELQPARCLELGTCLGISAAYQAAALEFEGGGTLLTLEGMPSRAAVAQKNLARLALGNVEVVVGRFEDTLGTVLDAAASIGFAFIDGHHEEAATLRYFEQILPHLAPEAVVVFDDIGWSRGMQRAWRAIQEHPHAAVCVDLFLMGIVAVDPQPGASSRYAFALE